MEKYSPFMQKTEKFAGLLRLDLVRSCGVSNRPPWGVRGKEQHPPKGAPGGQREGLRARQLCGPSLQVTGAYCRPGALVPL